MYHYQNAFTGSSTVGLGDKLTLDRLGSEHHDELGCQGALKLAIVGDQPDIILGVGEVQGELVWQVDLTLAHHASACALVEGWHAESVGEGVLVGVCSAMR